jgi:hypothetical protein
MMANSQPTSHRRFNILDGFLPGLLAVVSLLTCGFGLFAQQGQIPIAQLPIRVSQSMSTTVPGATYKAAKMIHAFGADVYEIDGQTVEGQELRIIVNKNGETLAVDTAIKQSEIPKEVNDTLDRWLKDFHTTAIARSVREGGVKIWYEFVGTSKSGQPTRVEIRSDGKKIVIEE